MSKAADIGSKRLTGLAPDAWVQWVTQQPDVVAEEILAADFQWVSRESDVLVRAVSPVIGHFLVLSEVQLRYDSRMTRRIEAYAALAEERYDVPVYPVLVNILPPPAGVVVATRYESTVFDLSAWRQYRVLNLWEVDAAIVFQQPLPALLPFVPVLWGGDTESMVRQARDRLRAEERLSDLEPLLAFFASYAPDIRVVQQIMRWDMVVLRRSPWYQEILEEGRQEGRQEGFGEGLDEGRTEELRRQILHILAFRFGSVPSELPGRLQRLTLAQLDPLSEAALAADSVADFQARLDG